MRFLKKVLLAAALCGAAMGASASPAEPKNGVEYETLATPQATESGKKIEVTEFFAYYCPHCNVLEPQLAAWVKKQGDNIVFKRVHVSRDDSVAPQQRLFFTLQAMGLVDKLHTSVFHAMHVERNRLATDDAVFDFVAKQGVDRQKFIDTYRSMGISARVRRADAMMQGYNVTFWPMIAIDGRYITSPSQADQGSKSAKNEEQLNAQALSVMDVLVAKAKAEKK
ncbi:thiol:disulfide interchange protein DsbA/DsbL [Janthinobacterium sp. FW305-129]|uniref:thiol:disulfide interchange protein DsbA/DsbL n=1 Tax=Janthinobacterium sp. FW305-129 TaxID=2775054 RepID=UPI001E34B288|nr:thiol:disulfide interchange protein DsbA/DsbL [Janthinobacterium sp. FW305-129]MCC7600211.1 thiol:disulfide interchange protein DsbA/DsbL [Janthinobacterium sp. FW305-129]